MGKTNHKQRYAIKAECEQRIRKICPGIPYSSGIYFFHRIDENGIRRGYCGQAVHLCERAAKHLVEHDHIALSLKSHGFYSEDNPYGWKLSFQAFPKHEIDEKEKLYIRKYADAGFQMYNVSLGGQGKNRAKGQLAERKPAKGYYDGLRQGKKTLARELSHIINTHLQVSLKPEKQNNKVSVKAFEKFKALIDEKNYEKES